MFVTGRAGTGKSTLIKEMIKCLDELHGEEHVYVTSSTGISACQIGGTTVHSFGGIFLGEDPVEDLLIKMFQNARMRWKLAKVLIIDEISMLRPDTFDKLEQIARTIRRSSRPFGGIQVIACGDFYQLPPVYKGEDSISYCFEAESWPKVISVSYELKMVFRQRDDTFLAVLDDMRRGNLSPDSMALLSTRVGAAMTCQSGSKIKPTLLRSRRETALHDNLAELSKLTGQGWKSTATDWAESASFLRQLKEGCQAPEVLLMRVGAQVLLLKNLSVSGGLCNGTAGIIVDIVDGEPKVEFPSRTLTLSKADWEIKVGKKVVARRTQFPLTLGWAITIHKSQGMTLEMVNAELSHLFVSGQGYTALSRVRSLGGLSIDCVPSVDSIVPNEKVVSYYESLK
jgi:ATP-dependent DNA helicase PIF1